MINVVFDMDGVLFDTQKIYLKTWYEVAQKLNIPDIEKPAFECVGRNKNDQKAILARFYPQGFPYEEFYRLKDETFDAYVSKNVPLMEGTIEILEYLKSINAKVAIASSSRNNVIKHHIQLKNIDGYFDKIVSGDMVEHSKPSPDIYLKACKELMVNPAETFAVEDSYNGVKSAAAAGLKTIMIPDVQPFNSEMEKLVYSRFDSLLELKTYLKAYIN